MWVSVLEENTVIVTEKEASGVVIPNIFIQLTYFSTSKEAS